MADLLHSEEFMSKVKERKKNYADKKQFSIQTEISVQAVRLVGSWS